jgi:hypothetical protein
MWSNGIIFIENLIEHFMLLNFFFFFSCTDWFLGIMEFISSSLRTSRSAVHCTWYLVSLISLALFFNGCQFFHQLYLINDNNCMFSRSSLPSVNSLGRWFGETVAAAIINTDVSIFWYLYSKLIDCMLLLL